MAAGTPGRGVVRARHGAGAERRRWVSAALLVAVGLCVFGNPRLMRPVTGFPTRARAVVSHDILSIRRLEQGRGGVVRHSLLQQRARRLSSSDLPPFFMRIKVAEGEISDDTLARELERVVEEHVAVLLREQLPGAAAVPLLHAALTRARRPDGHAMLEVAFTGTLHFAGYGREASSEEVVSLLRRGLLTREEYTRLVDRMHSSAELPLVRGVKVSLVPFPNQTLEPQAPEKVPVSPSEDPAARLAAEGYRQMRLIALLSFGGLLSIVLFVVDFLIRPKRKNWKVARRRSSDFALSWGGWFRRRRPASARPPGWRRPPARDVAAPPHHRRAWSGEAPALGRPAVGAVPVPVPRASAPARSSSHDKLEAMVVQRNAALARRSPPVLARSHSLDVGGGDGSNGHGRPRPGPGSSLLPPASPPRRGRRRASLEVVSGADGIL